MKSLGETTFSFSMEIPTDWPECIHDLIFCNVILEDGGRSYCYLADTDDLEKDER